MIRFSSRTLLGAAVVGALLAFSAGAAEKSDKKSEAAERGSTPKGSEEPMKIGPKGAKGGEATIPAKDSPKSGLTGSPPRGTADAKLPGKSDNMPNPQTPRAETDKDVDKKKK